MHRNPLIRGALVATAVLGLTVAAAGSASAQPPASRTERLVLNFQTIGGIDRTTHVTATGPISGSGYETQTEIETPTGEIVEFTLHFADGTVTAQSVEDYHFMPNYRSCTAQATGTGTWNIVSGTGAFEGAQGGGTFSDSGHFVGNRDAHGVCDTEVEPALAVFLLQATGTVSLGAAS